LQSEVEKLLAWAEYIEATTLDLSSQSGAYDLSATLTLTLCYINNLLPFLDGFLVTPGQNKVSSNWGPSNFNPNPPPTIYLEHGSHLIHHNL